MPVFYRDKLKILCIHMPKTGCTAIELFFEDNGFNTQYLDRDGPNTVDLIRNCSPQHMTAETLSKVSNCQLLITFDRAASGTKVLL